MLNLILILSFLQFAFGSYRSKILSCGLFAYSGPKDLSPDLKSWVISNIKILGIMNDSRGGDGAGMFFDNQVLKKGGVKFSEFFAKEGKEFDNIQNISTIFGHSRKSSVGFVKNDNNTHPFEIYEDEKAADPGMMGIHNGTIQNWRDLGKKYSIDVKNIDVDSEAMMAILFNQRKAKFKLFQEYYGTGVFIWTYIDEPDTIYFFKGASKEFYHSDVQVEERPLFYFVCSKTKGVFLSSLEDSLKVIASNNEEIYKATSNLVFKLKCGKMLGKGIEIDRKEAGHKEFFTQTTTRRTIPRDTSNSESGTHIIKTHTDITTTNKGYTTTLFDRPSVKNYSEHRIWRENHAYFRNGHRLNGVFIINMKTCQIISSIPYINKSAHDLDAEVNAVIKHMSPDVSAYYFIHGIMLKNSACFIGMTLYLTAKGITTLNDKSSISIINAKELSKYIRYPYCFNTSSGLFLLNEKHHTGTEYPVMAEGKEYVFMEGRLKSITSKSSVKDSEPVFKMLKESQQKTNNFSTEWEEDEDKIISKELAKQATNQTEIKFETEINDEMDENAKLFYIAENEVVELFNKLMEAVNEAKLIYPTCMNTKEFESSTLSGVLDCIGIDTTLNYLESNDTEILDIDVRKRKITLKKEINELF